MAKSRFTNDELDELILYKLEAYHTHRKGGAYFGSLKYSIIYYTAPQSKVTYLDYMYEERQLARRIQWLARHGFIHRLGECWRITDPNSIKERLPLS
jgi:hypothetical protein